jgi:metal-responsive CopG/Arc/MetJ family transcriptional regulator
LTGPDGLHILFHMKAVQLTMDSELLEDVDLAARERKTTRSAWVRHALRAYLVAERRRRLEEADRQGYARMPVRPGEFEEWDEVAAWPPE